MAENSKSGCISLLIILVILGLIGSGIEKCASNHHKRQDIILPSYSSFKMDNEDPQVYFQTFDSQTYACLKFFWESGKTANMYVSIKNGNDLYDKNDSPCGHIIVNKDGSFNIKGWDVAKGHYVGLDGAIMSYKDQKSKSRSVEEGYGKNIPSWLDGVWKASSTPVGDAIISIEGNKIKECVGGEINTGTFTVGENYIQVTYDGGSGVRYDLDMDNKRLGLGEGYWLSKNDESTSGQVLPSIDKDILTFLQSVYPNQSDAYNGNPNREEYVTNRFLEYTVECEMDPIYLTQDAYAAEIKPNPQFIKYDGYDDAYKITWHRYEQNEEVTNIVVLSRENGKYLIDNIINERENGPILLFDYSKPAVPVYD